MNTNAKETLVSGFTFWAWCRAKPRGVTAQAFIRHVKSDSRFPKHVDSRDVLKAWVRYGPRMPAHVRRAESQVWRGYAAWRRARALTSAGHELPAGIKSGAEAEALTR